MIQTKLIHSLFQELNSVLQRFHTIEMVLLRGGMICSSLCRINFDLNQSHRSSRVTYFLRVCSDMTGHGEGNCWHATWK